MEGEPVTEGVFAFSYKTAWTHFSDFVSKPVPILAGAIGVFGVLWTFGEASIQFTDADPRGWRSYALLIAASLATSLVYSIYRYTHQIPEGLENTPRPAQRIAHLQRPLWEFRLAKSLLAYKLAPFERELTDLEVGRTFVIAEKPETLQAYMRWVNGRFVNMTNMMAVAQQLILKDFPAAIQSTSGKSANPIAIMEVAESIGRFYGETVAFERDARAVSPSEALTTLHQLQFGWSEPIRVAVRQLFQFLQQMCECNLNEDTNISFEIIFPGLEKVDQFCDELSRLEPSFHRLEQDW